MLMRRPLLSQHVKLSRRREKNWDTHRPTWDRRGGQCQGRKGRQWKYRRRDDKKDARKEDHIRVVEFQENNPQEDE